MENFLHTIPLIKYRSSFSLPLAPDQRLALMSTQDIGRTAAGLLLNATWTGQEGAIGTLRTVAHVCRDRCSDDVRAGQACHIRAYHR